MDLRHEDREYTALVLSGGGSKCIATIGALHYLSIHGYLNRIETFAGTSAGAIICYLLVIGYSPFEIMFFLTSSTFIDEFANINLAAIIEQKGLISYSIVEGYLQKLTIEKFGMLPTFKDLPFDLDVVTFNLTKCRVEHLNRKTTPDLAVLTALRMSSSVPLLFERCFVDDCEYIDGGIVNNFPFDEIPDTDRILAIDIRGSFIPPRKRNLLEYLFAVSMTPFYFFGKKTPPESATVIAIESGTSTFNFTLSIHDLCEIFSRGYSAAKSRNLTPPSVRSSNV